MRTYHNTNIIVQTTGGDESSINGKRVIPNNTLTNITIALLLNSSPMKNFGDTPIIMEYGSTTKLITGYVVMFLASYVMHKYHHTNI